MTCTEAGLDVVIPNEISNVHFQIFLEFHSNQEMASKGPKPLTKRIVAFSRNNYE